MPNHSNFLKSVFQSLERSLNTTEKPRFSLTAFLNDETILNRTWSYVVVVVFYLLIFRCLGFVLVCCLVLYVYFVCWWVCLFCLVGLFFCFWLFGFGF